MSTEGLSQYMKTQVETATPLQLVVMLYDGAIRNIGLATEAITEGNVEKKTQAVDKLLAILGELQSTLDMERGGEIAVNLNALYTYFCEQVVTASVKMDAEPLQNVGTLLDNIRSAWHEIAQRPAAETVPAPLPAAAAQAAAAPRPEGKRVSVRT